MPYKRYPRRKKRGRRRTRRKYVMPRKVVARPGTLGQSRLQKFRYCDRITLNPGLGGAVTHSFAANGLYDPDVSGVGHQPIGFDQVMNFYNHYTVVGAKLKATFVARNANTVTDSAIVGIELSGNSSPTTIINDVLEQSHSNWRTLTNGHAKQDIIVSNQVSVKKYLKQSPLQEDANAGTASGNPDELIYFHVFALPTNSGDDNSEMDVIIELEQVAVLHEPKTLIGS